MKFYVLGILFLLGSLLPIFAMVAPGGNNCQVPFTPCWCIQNNNPCANQGIPINNELWVLLAVGLIMGIYFLKKNSVKAL